MVKYATDDDAWMWDVYLDGVKRDDVVMADDKFGIVQVIVMHPESRSVEYVTIAGYVKLVRKTIGSGVANGS